MLTWGTVGSWAITTLEIHKCRMITICLGKLRQRQGTGPIDLLAFLLSLIQCLESPPLSTPVLQQSSIPITRQTPHCPNLKVFPWDELDCSLLNEEEMESVASAASLLQPPQRKASFCPARPPQMPGWSVSPSCVGLEDVDPVGDSWFLQESWAGWSCRANPDLSSCYTK